MKMQDRSGHAMNGIDANLQEQGLEVDALEAMKEALEALQGETFEVSGCQVALQTSR